MVAKCTNKNLISSSEMIKSNFLKKTYATASKTLAKFERFSSKLEPWKN